MQSIPMVKHRQADWFQFRRRHPDLGIAKTGDDGSTEDWQALLREVGQDTLTTAVIRARSGKRDGGKVWFADVLGHLPGENSDEGATPTPDDGKVAKKSRADLLVWCICHSSTCYADAIKPWADAPGEDSASKRTYIGTVRRVPKVDPLTPEQRARYCRMADEWRQELFEQVGLEDNQRNRTRLYYIVAADKHLIVWLVTQRALPA